MFRVINKDGKTLFTGSREECRSWANNEATVAKRQYIVR
jgi:hypothetical protein